MKQIHPPGSRRNATKLVSTRRAAIQWHAIKSMDILTVRISKDKAPRKLCKFQFEFVCFEEGGGGGGSKVDK